MQATQYWTYEVEASSQEEALNKVSDGDVDPIDYGIDSDGDNQWDATCVEITDTYEKPHTIRLHDPRDINHKNK